MKIRKRGRGGRGSEWELEQATKRGRGMQPRSCMCEEKRERRRAGAAYCFFLPAAAAALPDVASCAMSVTPRAVSICAA